MPVFLSLINMATCVSNRCRLLDVVVLLLVQEAAEELVLRLEHYNPPAGPSLGLGLEPKLWRFLQGSPPEKMPNALNKHRRLKQPNRFILLG